MDREQEDLQSLGAFGIFKESFKLISTNWRKIFMNITLALVLPHSCNVLIHFEISTFLNHKILNNYASILSNNATQVSSQTSSNNVISNSISSEWTAYWLFNAAYLLFSVTFFLLSVSAIVYTIACIYIGDTPTFKRAMSVVRKVWKRLMITFLCNFCIIFVYTFIFALFTLLLVGVVIASSISNKSLGGKVGLAILVSIAAILYMVGWAYLGIVWQLANVISVTEKNCGFQAMAKSKALIKGKMGTAIGIYLLLALSSLPNYFLIKQLGKIDVGFGKSICYGILSLVLMTCSFLIIIVVQTVLYFVCKSYHHESIDKSLLADHLATYLGEYVPLNSKDVEIQRFHV